MSPPSRDSGDDRDAFDDLDQFDSLSAHDAFHRWWLDNPDVKPWNDEFDLDDPHPDLPYRGRDRQEKKENTHDQA